MGNVQRSTIVALNTVISGQKTSTAAASAVALASDRPVRSLVVRALSQNSSVVHIGPAGITSSTGYELSAGEPVAIDIDNLASVYLKVAVDNDGVCFLGVLNQ